MEDMSKNNLIRFIDLKKKKDGIFANFKVKGIKGGVVYTASIAVDITAAEVDPTDPLEKIVEVCSEMAVKEFRKADYQFEGISSAL
ncbi:MAG: hypothetical protein Tsb0021_02490 [Chlamydiales bacterium]